MKCAGIIKSIVFAAVTLLAATGVWADTWTDPDTGYTWTYTISNGEASMGGGSSDSTAIPTSTRGAINIPSTLGGYPVTRIGDYAFVHCGVSSVTIPDSVTSIGAEAFEGCSGLTSVILPDSVTSIGSGAFNYCSGLTCVTIPNKVTSIGSWVFANCGGLAGMKIPINVTSIGNQAFYNCIGLTDLEIPESVMSIGNDAFFGCSGLKDVVVPQCLCTNRISTVFPSSYQAITNVVICDGVTSIGDYAFANCGALTRVTIPESVTSIGDGVFYNCGDLMSVKLPNSITNIGDRLFYSCSSLMSILLPNSVVNIGDEAFNGCCGLTSVVLPNNVMNIGDNAFAGCNGLTSMVIPDSVIRIGGSAFGYCTSLISLEVSSCNELYKSVDGLVLSMDGHGLVAVPGGLSSVTIPDSVTSLCEGALCGCRVKGITIPGNVTNISFGAFFGCKELRNVTIPNSVTHIGNRAFYNCSELTSIAIPDSVMDIGEEVFNGCSELKNVTVPQCICNKSMASVFSSSYQSITNVVILNTVTSIGSEALYDCRGLSHVVIPNSVTSIGDSAFAGCSGLTSVTIPDTVMRIGEGAFAGCNGLEKISLPFVGSRRGISGSADSVFGYIFGSHGGGLLTCQYYSSYNHQTYYIPSSLKTVVITDESSVGYGAFYGCSGLTNVTIPNSVMDIGDSAFAGCSSLENITLPFVGNRRGNSGYVDYLFGYIFGANPYYGGMAIKQYASPSRFQTYYVPSSLKTVVITDESSLRFGAFYGCSGLENVKVTSGVTSIGDSAFYGCSGLMSTEIPYSVTNIEDSAFSCCSNLTYVTIPCNVVSVGNNAFDMCRSLTNVTIEIGLTSIGEYAFSGCSGLASVTIPSSVTRIGDCAFSGCNELTNIVFLGDSPMMGSDVFRGKNAECIAVVPGGSTGWLVDIPGTWNGIHIKYCAYTIAFDANGGEGGETNVLDYASEVVAPTVTRENYTFVGWAPVVDTTVPASNVTYTAQWLCDWSYSTTIEGTLVVEKPNFTPIGRLAVPSKIDGMAVVGIADRAFENCTGISEVVLPSGLKSIGFQAFRNCTGLTTMIVPNGVTNVGAYAFCDCVGLTNVSIPDSVTTIEQGTFCNCVRLADLAIPNTVTSIGDESFSCCSNLTSIAISTNVQSIGYSTFYGCCGLTNVTIEGGVVSIGDYAFADCSGLVNITIPDSVTRIGKGAFSGCRALTSITLPFVGMEVGHSGSPEALFGYVFGVSPFDGSIQVKQSYVIRDYGYAYDLAYSVFYLPRRLESVAITSTTMLGTGAFYGCTNIVSLALPGSIKSVGKWAVAACGGLRTLIIDSDTSTAFGEAILNVGTDCTIKVPNGSTGWDVDIPGMWNSWKIDYIIPIVQFDPNGGEVSTSVMQTAAGLIEDEMPVPAKTGYSSVGWFTKPVGGEELKVGAMLDGSVQVYAHWTANEYVVSLDPNGGDVSNSQITVFYDAKYGTMPIPSMMGYSFAGWQLDGVTVSQDTVVKTADDHVLVASWTPNDYLVSYDPNGGIFAGAVDTNTVTFGEAYGEQPVPVRTGHNFVGWMLEDELIMSNTVVSASEDHTLVAQWAVNRYLVAFDACGGEGGVTNEQDYASAIVPPEVVREGCTFTGWVPEVDATVPASNVTYVAQWLLNKYTVTLNPNGGEGTESIVVEYGSVIGSFPTTARNGYMFLGWFTEADGGEKIGKSVVVTGDITFYAHWLANNEIRFDLAETYKTGTDGTFDLILSNLVLSATTPKITVKGLPTGLKFDAKTGVITGKATKPGKYTVTVSATNATVKKPVTATFDIVVPNFTTEMFEGAGLVADGKYVLCAGVAPDLADVIKTITDDGWKLAVSGLPSGIKYDAKNGVFTGVATKEGCYTVTFTAKRGSGKAAEKDVATATFEVVFPEVTLAVAAWDDESATNKVKVAGGGKYPFGKKVTLKAMPAKGNVFMGWYDDYGVLVGQSASYPYVTTDEDVTLTAVFITVDEDKAGVSLAVDGTEMRRVEDAAPCQTNVMCGVYMEWPLAVEALSLPTVAVAGLPTGLKFTAKDLVDSKTKQVTVPANTIYGTPTAASKVDAKTGTVKPSVVKVTVTTAGKSKVAYEIDVTVDAVKEWAVGTFDGAAFSTGETPVVPVDAQERVPPAGLVQAFTVSAAGKISGKLLEGGKTWTLSAANFDAYDAEAGVYTATVLGKSGKEAVTNEVKIASETVRRVEDNAPYQRGVVNGRDVRSPSATGETPVVPVEWTAWQNLWKVEPWKSDAKPFAKAPSLALYVVDDNAVGRVVLNAPPDVGSPYGTLSLKFASSGAVTASGKFVTGQDAKGKDVVYSASCSSVLVPAGGNAYTVYLYFPPKDGKFDGYAAEVPLAWDGSAFSLGE